MKDKLLIEKMLQRGREAADIVIKEFSELSELQLNWKASEENWSIGQCLDHLIVSDCLYFPVLKKIAGKNYTMTVWEKWSPLSGFFGKMLVQQLGETVNKKVKAPRVFVPASSNIDLGIMERFQKHLDTLFVCIDGCKELDLDKIYITSPVSKLVTYNLRHAITILIQHLHRHINQAKKVKALKAFPLNK